MKKDSTMKKITFLKGTIITTIGIVITKILGLLYVIPFHSIIGDEGGALYGYAYTIYLFFMSISTAGIPLAISKIVSEYQTLGYMKAKKRVFTLSKRISLLLGFVSFLIIMLFSPVIAKGILGNATGGNSIEDISFVIRVIGTAILIVPVLSIYRGYFEGHRFMSPPSISQVIEQLFRVFIIIFGSLSAIKVFHFSISSAVGIALFGATAGAIISYLYLVNKLRKNKNKFNDKLIKKNEPIVSDKEIFRKLIIYAVPFIMIDLFKSLYNTIDMVTVVKGLVKVSYSTVDAETIYSMVSTWGAKFNMVILAISSGIIVNLIPNLSSSIVKKDYKGCNDKVIQSLNILLFLALPITFGISFLAKPIWYLFYGNSLYGPNVLSYYIFVGLFMSLATIVVTILQCYKDYKGMFISLSIGVVLKLILNNNLLYAFNKMSFPAYYGVITASIIGYFTTFIIALILLKKKYGVSYENLIKNLVDYICGTILMIMLLFVIKFFIPIYSSNRVLNIIIIVLYGLVGCFIYFFYAYKAGCFEKIFGKKFINNIKRVFNKKSNR